MKKKKLLIGLSIVVVSAISSCKKDFPEPSGLNDQTVNTDQQTAGDEHMTGALVLPSDQYNKLPKAEAGVNYVEAEIPSSASLTCPPVLNQGNEGSCVAWATAYAARSIMEMKATGASSYSASSNIFSPEYVYNQIKVSADCGSGTYLFRALDIMSSSSTQPNRGVCTWNYMPSADGCSTMPDAAACTDAASHTISSWGTLSEDVAAIKYQVAIGVPVIVVIRVDRNFFNLGSKVYSSYNDSKFEGNHALCVVGYDDSKSAFKVMNSWGTKWGVSGYGWINYNLVNTIMFNEVYVMNY